MKNPPVVILVPGLWLGGWAWDEVVEHLARDGFPAVAVTLPGLESPATRRHGIGLSDHVAAVTDAIRDAAGPVILVAHSGAGALATAVLDQNPDLVRHVVYVDSGPVADGTIARPDLDPLTVELPFPTWTELQAGGASLDGLSEEMLQRFETHAVAHPAGPLRDPVCLNNPARNQVPTTLVCCSIPSAVVKQMATGGGMFAALADLTNTHYADLPTGHWPMWSAPDELAKIIVETARLTL